MKQKPRGLSANVLRGGASAAPYSQGLGLRHPMRLCSEAFRRDGNSAAAAICATSEAAEGTAAGLIAASASLREAGGANAFVNPSFVASFRRSPVWATGRTVPERAISPK